MKDGEDGDGSRLFRPEAIEAHGAPDRPRILPPISAPAVRSACLAVTVAVLAALAVGLSWHVPQMQRVTVVVLPEARGVVVLSDPDEVAQISAGDTVSADFGGSLELELRIGRVAGVRTPEQVQAQFGASRLAAIATVPVGLSRATPQGGEPVPDTLGDAAAGGIATIGRERVIELVARKLL
ncbi:MAG: hypothetical protein Q8O56_04700 [Solirubrobacteraceae bacterium]|nr:hypothetical protein [Solirubrobacteraceae bacterium]